MYRTHADMKKTIILLGILLLSAGFLPVLAQDDICPEPTDVQTVKAYLENCDNLKMFTVLLDKHDLLDKLARDENRTIMAPVNEAFTELQEEDLEQFMSNERLQRSILARHIIQIDYPHLSDDVRVMQLRGTDENGQPTVFGMAELLVRNIPLKNGTIHIVSNLIWPPAEHMRD